MRGPVAKTTTCRACGRDFERPYRASIYVYCEPCAAKADREIARRPRVDCKECGKAFSTKTRTVRYCSDACRSASARRAAAKSRRKIDADPEKHAIRLARLRLTAARRARKDRGEKPPRASRDVKGLRPNPVSAEPYPCALCGRNFVPYGNARPVHCKRCRAKADREIGRKLAIKCKECGRAVAAPSRGAVYCSKECRADARRRVARESARRLRKDPEQRARNAARARAWAAAHRGGKKGRGRRPSA